MVLGESICLPKQAMQERWVRSWGQEDPLEEEMATHSSILAWKIQWTEEPGGLQSTGLQRVRHDCVTYTYTFLIRGLIAKLCLTPQPRGL